MLDRFFMNQSFIIGTDQGGLRIRFCGTLAIDRIWLPELLNGVSTADPVPGWLSGLASRITSYFKGAHVDFHAVCHYFTPSQTVPFLDGSTLTPFQQQVYECVAQVPYGEVLSYGEVAAQIGRPNAARAVGRAMGANPFPLIIPCHRVVSASGLGGFSGGCGVELKRHMLALEGIQIG